MQTEKHLHDYLRKETLKLGGSFDKVESRSRRGFPDCLLVYKGRVVFVELKSPAGTGKLSPLQLHAIDLLTEAGAAVYVIDSAAQVDSLMATLKAGET